MFILLLEEKPLTMWKDKFMYLRISIIQCRLYKHVTGLQETTIYCIWLQEIRTLDYPKLVIVVAVLFDTVNVLLNM